MKSLYLVAWSSIAIFQTITLSAQEVSLNRLLKYQTSNFAVINDELSKGDWEFSHTKKKNPGIADSSIVWSFQKNDNGNSPAWIELNLIRYHQYIVYQFTQKTIYNNIKSNLDVLKYKLIESSVVEDEIRFVYELGGNTILIIIRKIEHQKHPNYYVTAISSKAWKIVQLNILSQTGKMW